MIDRLEPRIQFHQAFLVGTQLIVQAEDVNDTLVFDLDTGRGLITLHAAENGNAEADDFFLSKDVKSVVVYGNGGSDMIDLSQMVVPCAVDAGKGGDTILGGHANDTLKGGAGSDSILGNDGNDVIDGGYGSDRLFGNRGRDLVDYAKRTAPVIVGLGSSADDGEVGEHDMVTTTFEIIRGGSGNDTLRTTVSSPVTLVGGPGDDTLTGGAGNDVFDGGPGVDLMIGNAGNDSFYAQDGNIERLQGGSGTDVILSKDKKDKLYDIP